MSRLGDRSQQFAGLCLIGLLQGLVMESRRESMTPVEIIALLGAVKEMPELFDPDVVAEYDEIDGVVEAMFTDGGREG